MDLSGKIYKAVAGAAVAFSLLGAPLKGALAGPVISCDDLNLQKPSVSGLLLGCAASGISETTLAELQEKGYPWDVTAIFSELPEDEKLLARASFIVPGESYPGIQELGVHLDPRLNQGPGALSVADLLIIYVSWHHDVSLMYELLRIEPDKDQFGPIARLIYDATLLAIARVYGQDWLNSEEDRYVDTQRVIGSLQDSQIPWARAILALQHLSGGSGVQDVNLAAELFYETYRDTPFAGKVAARITAEDSPLEGGFSEEAVATITKWAAAGNIIAIDSIEEVTDASPNYQSIQPFNFGNQLLIAARYGVPDLQYEVGADYYYGTGSLGPDMERGEQWLRVAAKNGHELARDWYIDDLLREGDHEGAFRQSLINAAEGYVYVRTFGFQLSYLLSKLVYSEEDAYKWQDFLAYQCQNAPILWEASTACPKRHTDKAFVLLRPHELPSAETIDIREQGAYELATGQFHAVLLGNSEYESWPSLSTPDEDLLAVETVLREKYGFQTRTVLNGGRREMLKAIYDVGQEASFGDHVLIYYAGHGVIDRNSDVAYWIPSDGGRDFAPDWVSAQEVMNAFKTIPAKHLLLVADSCYSGKLLRGSAQSAPNATESVVRRLFQKKARVALTSGGEEPVEDSASGSKHSVFAQAFLTSLEENGSPLPASTLYDMVLTHVSAEASQTPQYSDMRELGHDGGDFIFVPADW